MMIENERSKAPIYYIVFESLITAAMYFYVPQTIAFFTSIFLSTIMYLYASCKNPGYVDQSPFVIEDQNVNIQMQIQRFQGAIRKSEIDKNQDKSSDDEKEDNYVGIIGQLKKYVRKSQSFRSKSLRSKETSLTNSQPKSNQKTQGSNQNSPTTVNKTEDLEQEGAQQGSTLTLNFQTQNDQQENQQKGANHQLQGNTELDNPLELLYVNDMSPNYMSAQGSQFDLSELQSENDPGSNNSPKSFRFEEKNQNNPIQAFAEVLVQNNYQKQNQKSQQEPQKKICKLNQEVIDETQAASERTAVSYGLGGISSFIIQGDLENEQKIQTELNTDVSLIQENKQISNYQCAKNLDTDDFVMQQSPEKKQTQKQSNEQNMLRNSQNNASVSSSLEFSENSLQNFRQSSNSNNSSSSEQVERPFLKQRKKDQTLSPFYIINEDEEGDYSQQENRISGISNKEENKENSFKAKQTNSENKENKKQANTKSEIAQSARDSSNLSYVSADFNDSHVNIQVRDINKRISLDSNLNQERESVESEKKDNQNLQKKQQDSLSPQKLSQSNLIIVENRYCTVCNLEQPTRAKHCRECGRCVATHDHHCP